MDSDRISVALDEDGQLTLNACAKRTIAGAIKAMAPYTIFPIGEYELGMAIILIPKDSLLDDPQKIREYAEWVYLRTKANPTRPILIAEAKAIEARGRLPSASNIVLTIKSEAGKRMVSYDDDIVQHLNQAANTLRRMTNIAFRPEHIAMGLAVGFPPGEYVLGRDIDLENSKILESLLTNLEKLKQAAEVVPERGLPEEEDGE